MNDKEAPCGVPFDKGFLKPKYWLTWLGLALSAIISLFPTSVRHWIGRRVGQLFYRLNSKRAGVVTANLEAAFPELSASERELMAIQSSQWFGCALVDYSLLFFASRKRLNKLIRIEGQEGLDEAIASEKNVVLLLSHSVWLDFAPAGLGAFYQLYGSYKPVKNPLIDWVMAKSRCKYVGSVISREQGMMKLVRSLKPGKCLIFLPDEDLGAEHSDFAPFFGVEKATLNTPARIAKLKQASCFPCFTFYDVAAKQYCISIGKSLSPFPATDAEESARVLNKALEAQIKMQPRQYMWQLKYYRTRPEGQVSLY